MIFIEMKEAVFNKAFEEVDNAKKSIKNAKLSLCNLEEVLCDIYESQSFSEEEQEEYDEPQYGEVEVSDNDITLNYRGSRNMKNMMRRRNMRMRHNSIMNRYSY